MKEIFTDILKEKAPEKGDQLKWSQSRVYLFVSFTLILVVLSLQMLIDIDIDRAALVVDNLYYLIVIFSGYALGTKGLKEIKNLKK